MAFPNTCKTPAAPSPLPLPYPTFVKQVEQTMDNVKKLVAAHQQELKGYTPKTKAQKKEVADSRAVLRQVLVLEGKVRAVLDKAKPGDKVATLRKKLRPIIDKMVGLPYTARLRKSVQIKTGKKKGQCVKP